MSCPWLPHQHRELSKSSFPTSLHALHLWDDINRQGLNLPSISPLAPLGGFPWLEPGECLSFFRTWAADGEVRCSRFIQEHGFLSLEALREQYRPFFARPWWYRQLHHFVHLQSPKIHPLCTLTQFGRLCMEKDPIPHSISVMY